MNMIVKFNVPEDAVCNFEGETVERPLTVSLWSRVSLAMRNLRIRIWWLIKYVRIKKWW